MSATDALPPLLLDEPAVARLLSCSKAHVRRMVRAGSLPEPADIGLGLKRWHRAAVEEAAARLCGLLPHQRASAKLASKLADTQTKRLMEALDGMAPGSSGGAGGRGGRDGD